ncbi:translation initiation factor 6 (eIF-6) [Tunturiibacter psychrotolerans]|jgi:hypothetical protein
MSDPNHTELMDQIHSSEREIDALQNKINACDDSTTTNDYAAMRREQEKHRQRILKSKADIDQNKWSE